MNDYLIEEVIKLLKDDLPLACAKLSETGIFDDNIVAILAERDADLHDEVTYYIRTQQRRAEKQRR